jgi:hypothetical protein
MHTCVMQPEQLPDQCQFWAVHRQQGLPLAMQGLQRLLPLCAAHLRRSNTSTCLPEVPTTSLVPLLDMV